MPQCSSDSEQDYETMEQERRMAADDLEEEDESKVVAKGDIVLSTSVLDTMTVGMCVQAVNVVSCMMLTCYHTGTDRTVDDDHIWKLAPEQRKQLIVNTLGKHYSEGVDYMKECLREYNEVCEEYEVMYG